MVAPKTGAITVRAKGEHTGGRAQSAGVPDGRGLGRLAGALGGFLLVRAGEQIGHGLAVVDVVAGLSAE